MAKKFIHPSPPLSHGGSLAVKKRKSMRPLDIHRPLHIVLKSERARGALSMLHARNKKRVKNIVYKYSARYELEIYRYANVGNHLHIFVKTKTREKFQNFLRVTAGRIAIAVLNAKRGALKTGKFWSYLAFSRVVGWGRDFANVMNYIAFNLAQATGLVRKSDYARTPIVIWDDAFT